MAKKRSKPQEVLMQGGMAFAGGIGAEVVSDLIAQNAPDIVQKNPKLVEIAPAAIGLGMLYFIPGKADAVALGMIGAAGAGMSDDIIGGMQGFNRIMQGNEAEELQKGQDYIDEMVDEGFAANGYDDGNYSSMGY